jgi:serine/threonine-protein kinase RsbW
LHTAVAGRGDDLVTQRENGSNGNEVELTTPAQPEFIGLVRLTTASVAAHAGFGYDAVEDLRLAVDELCAPLVRSGPGGVLHFRLTWDEAGMELHCRPVDATPAPVDAEELGLSDLILGALVDEHRRAADGSGDTVWLRKRRSAVPLHDE